MGRSQEWVSRVERGAVTLTIFEFARLNELLAIPDAVIREIAWLGVDPGR